MRERWKKIRYRLEWSGCILLTKLVPLLPRMACVRLAHLIGTLAFHFDHHGRAVALANVEAAFGNEFSPAQREAMVRKSYRNFARTMLDLFWAPRLAKGGWQRWLSLENTGLLDTLRERKQGSITMCVHCGNWEWASLAVGFHGTQAQIVSEDFKNARLNAIFAGLRSVSGHQMIEQHNSMLRLFRVARSGRMAGMLADLSLRPSEASVVIEVFGLKTCVTLLHAVLANKAGAVVVPMHGRPQPDGTCIATLYPPLEFPPGASEREIAQACWNFFEPIIREDPGQWLWAYKHWRYLPKDAARPYPFYAFSSRDFDELLKRTGPADEAKRLTKPAT
jgi:lauroyl/myristoyl acyltransferase